MITTQALGGLYHATVQSLRVAETYYTYLTSLSTATRLRLLRTLNDCLHPLFAEVSVISAPQVVRIKAFSPLFHRDSIISKQLLGKHVALYIPPSAATSPYPGHVVYWVKHGNMFMCMPVTVPFCGQ